MALSQSLILSLGLPVVEEVPPDSRPRREISLSPRIPLSSSCLHCQTAVVVVNCYPKLTSDFNASITICDPTRSLIGTGLLCFFYRENADDLPQPLATGEILIAYDMKIRPHNLDIQAWSTHTTRFKLVSPGFDIRALKSDEHVMVKEMREWWNARGGAPGAKGEVVKRDKEGGIVNEDGVYTSKKMKRISEMEVNTFSDLVCEVSPSLLYLCTSLPTSVPARLPFSFTSVSFVYFCAFICTAIDIPGGQNIPRKSIYALRHRLHPKHLSILLSMVCGPQRLERSLRKVYPPTRLLGQRCHHRRNVQSRRPLSHQKRPRKTVTPNPSISGWI